MGVLSWVASVYPRRQEWGEEGAPGGRPPTPCSKVGPPLLGTLAPFRLLPHTQFVTQ